MTDVLIAGGGIAGSALAMLLGRCGLAVEIFERSQFPREKPCGEGLMPAGVAALERLGLGEAVGGAPFYGVRYHFGDEIAVGRFPELAGVPLAGRAQRRRHLDHVLFQAAANTPGVTAHSGAPVEAPLVENHRVAGLVVRGEARRARLVVAADGLHSPLRRALGLARRGGPRRRKRVGIRAHFRLAPGQAQPPWVDVFARPGYELYVAALPERELLVAALADVGAWRDSAERSFHRCWRGEPALAARLEGAEQVTALLGASPLGSSARTGVAPGIVLLGDAASSLDPITGGGMTQALLSAELLAQHIPEHLGETESWLGEFERARRALLRDYAILSEMVLWCARHSRLAERLLRLLKDAPNIFSHLVAVSGGVHRLFTNPLRRGSEL
jgi:2-polyprenyl-6-methoxyphenol hydroxylase-like FAD-dependent oxidoreductase